MFSSDLEAVTGLDKGILFGYILFVLSLMNGCEPHQIIPTPPNANAGPDTVVWAGKQFTLDASSSQPFSPGDSLTFKWSMLEKPPTSTAGIIQPTRKLASFRPDLEGRYTVRLQVNGPGNSSSMDTVNITAVNCMAGEISVSEYALLYDEDFNSLPSTHWQFTSMDWGGEYKPPKAYAENGSLVLYSGADNYATFAKADLDLSHLDLATKDAVVIRMEINQVEFPYYSPPDPNSSLRNANEIKLQVLGTQIALKPVTMSRQNGQYITDRPLRLSNTVATLRITASEFLTGEENPWCTNLEVFFNAQPREAAKLTFAAKSAFNDIGVDFPSEFRIGRIQVWAR